MPRGCEARGKAHKGGNARRFAIKPASHQWAWLPLGLPMLVPAGCADRGYVKQADYDARISQIEARLQNQENRSDQLEQDMQQKFAQYDACGLPAGALFLKEASSWTSNALAGSRSRPRPPAAACHC